MLGRGRGLRFGIVEARPSTGAGRGQNKGPSPGLSCRFPLPAQGGGLSADVAAHVHQAMIA
eukprot:scaffold1411_cov396-Prasinococcus_capsulatus_cf.AAC.15